MNQFFFESNRRIEAKIEYEAELFREQTPIRNRILAFTYKYELTVTQYITTPIELTKYVDPETGNTVKTERKKRKDLADTLSIEVPSIVVKSEKRVQLMEDLKWLRENRDFLDHDLFIQFDKVFEFLIKYPLPEKMDEESLRASSWSNKNVQKEWGSILKELRDLCYNKINEFYSNK